MILAVESAVVGYAGNADADETTGGPGVFPDQ